MTDLTREEIQSRLDKATERAEITGDKQGLAAAQQWANEQFAKLEDIVEGEDPVEEDIVEEDEDAPFSEESLSDIGDEVEDDEDARPFEDEDIYVE
jgi:hypothetical protein